MTWDGTGAERSQSECISLCYQNTPHAHADTPAPGSMTARSHQSAPPGVVVG